MDTIIPWHLALAVIFCLILRKALRVPALSASVACILGTAYHLYYQDGYEVSLNSRAWHRKKLTCGTLAFTILYLRPHNRCSPSGHGVLPLKMLFFGSRNFWDYHTAPEA